MTILKTRKIVSGLTLTIGTDVAEHLPECPTAEIDCEVGDLGQCNCDDWHPCICQALRSCENRVRSEAYWNYPSINGELPPVFKDLGNPFDVARVAHEKGQKEGYLTGYGAAMEDGWGEPGHIRAAIAAAVQRVEALPHALECVTRDPNYSRPCNCLRGDALDAIKGDQE
jgi:hypothetical protein